jgi:hypothetical protein
MVVVCNFAVKKVIFLYGEICLLKVLVKTYVNMLCLPTCMISDIPGVSNPQHTATFVNYAYTTENYTVISCYINLF